MRVQEIRLRPALQCSNIPTGSLSRIRRPFRRCSRVRFAVRSYRAQCGGDDPQSFQTGGYGDFVTNWHDQHAQFCDKTLKISPHLNGVSTIRYDIILPFWRNKMRFIGRKVFEFPLMWLCRLTNSSASDLWHESENHGNYIRRCGRELC